MTSTTPLKVSILDYGAGNVRSVRNAIAANGYEIEDIATPEQISAAQVIVFPGVGAYGSAMRVLRDKGFDAPLKQYLRQDRPFLGICLGMQTLFEASDESEGADGPAIPGLGVIPGKVVKFDETQMKVPHIGWNGRVLHQRSPVFQHVSEDEHAYFVHSYYAPVTDQNRDWILTSTCYGGQRFVSAIQKGNVVATQFHPEKSGATGLQFLKGFLEVRTYAPMSDIAMSRGALLRGPEADRETTIHSAQCFHRETFVLTPLRIRTTGRPIRDTLPGNVPQRRLVDAAHHKFGEADRRGAGCAVQRSRRLGRHEGRPVRRP